jgi:predicted CopG family antitoxin
MIQFACFLIGFAIGYVILDIYVVKPCHNDYADLMLKNGKEYARHSEIIAKLLQDRENVRDLLLEYGVIRWETKDIVGPGEIIERKRCLLVQKDSDIIRRLLDRRKRLSYKFTLDDLLTTKQELNLNNYLSSYPEYMESKQ